MSMESPQIIKTATVWIYSHDMRHALHIFNEKLNNELSTTKKPKWLWISAGWKHEIGDIDIEYTAIREVGEETGITLGHLSGVFLDRNWKPVDTQEVIDTEGFNLNGKPAQDFLFYFRLHPDSPFENIANLLATTQTIWLTREQINTGEVELNGKIQQIKSGWLREKILRVMK